jgi:hypothetical protein
MRSMFASRCARSAGTCTSSTESRHCVTASACCTSDSLAVRPGTLGAGGSVEANIERWYGQFAQPDGGSTKDKASTKKLNVSGSAVTLVDVSGTYKDMPGGPFAGGQAVDRPDYRMLAAIVETPEKGSYFLKFYGPGPTVAKHADGFRQMVEGLVAAGK